MEKKLEKLKKNTRKQCEVEVSETSIRFSILDISKISAIYTLKIPNKAFFAFMRILYNTFRFYNIAEKSANFTPIYEFDFDEFIDYKTEASLDEALNLLKDEIIKLNWIDEDSGNSTEYVFFSAIEILKEQSIVKVMINKEILVLLHYIYFVIIRDMDEKGYVTFQKEYR